MIRASIISSGIIVKIKKKGHGVRGQQALATKGITQGFTVS